ncbi:MAG: tetratricopeptide repeat protein [Candidatus Binatia bacterium]
MGVRPPVILLIVLAAVAGLYVQALFGEFVGLDDYAYVKANSEVRRPNVVRMFDPKTRTVADWTPMVTLSHAIEYRLFGLDPLPYHAVNVALHLACIVLVYLLLLDLGFSAEVAWFASAVFAIHPFQVETVAWVSSRKNLLVALFGLGFCRAFLAGRLVMATALLLAALASKGTAVVFPIWVAILALRGFGRVSRARALPWLIGFFLLAVGRGWLSASAQAEVIAARAVGHMSLGQRMTIAGQVLATQLRQFFAPYDLCMNYFWSPGAWTDSRVLGSWAVVLAVASAVIWAARRDARVVAVGSLVAVALLPTLNIVPAPDFQADRYMHLAVIGASVLVVGAVCTLAPIHRWLPSVILVLWGVLVLVPTTRARIAVWRNTETMWQDVLRRNPEFAFGWNGLAMYYLEKGDSERAEQATRRALEIEPAIESARFNLALLLANRGSVAESTTEVRQLIDRHPSSARGHQLLGKLLADQGAVEEALAHLETALRLDPDDALALYQRARLYVRLGRLDDAARDFEAALCAHRASAPLSGLASVRLQQKQIAEAIALAREATDRNPQDAEAWDVLGRAFAAAGNAEAAESALRRAREAPPSATDPMTGRGEFHPYTGH